MILDNYSGGQRPSDTCNANNLVAEARVRSSAYYNVGSAQAHLLNCVAGGTLVAMFPEFYSQECLWEPNTRFEGWQPYRLNTERGTATAYFKILMLKFECYEWTGSCADAGVDRSQQ